jgi:F0F1-type ATP synthase assembly protein I
VPRAAIRYALYFGLAFDFIGIVIASAFVGWWLDRWLGVEPYAFLGCVLVAVAGGSVRLAIRLRGLERIDRGAEP